MALGWYDLDSLLPFGPLLIIESKEKSESVLENELVQYIQNVIKNGAYVFIAKKI